MADRRRAFVDTNVLVYTFDASEPEKRAAAAALLAGERDLVVSAQVLGELFVTLTRKLTPPVPASDARAAVDRLAGLDTVAIDAALVQDAIRIAGEAQLSYWDSLIVAAASAARCARLLTEDLSDGQVIEGVTVEDPFRAA